MVGFTFIYFMWDENLSLNPLNVILGLTFLNFGKTVWVHIFCMEYIQEYERDKIDFYFFTNIGILYFYKFCTKKKDREGDTEKLKFLLGNVVHQPNTASSCFRKRVHHFRIIKFFKQVCGLVGWFIFSSYSKFSIE